MDANYVQRLALGSLMIILVITTTPTALATAILPPAATTGLSGLTQPLPGDDMLCVEFRRASDRCDAAREDAKNACVTDKVAMNDHFLAGWRGWRQLPKYKHARFLYHTQRRARI